MGKMRMRLFRWGKIIFSLLIGVLLACYYVRMFRVMGIDSDYSNLLLEAKDIISGNPLLNGWTQTGISFLTTDLLYYVIAVMFVGATREGYWLASGLMTICMVASGYALMRVGQQKSYKLSEILFFSAICAFPTITGINLLRAHTGVYVWIFIALICFYKIYVEESKAVFYRVVFVATIVFGCVGDAIIYVILLVPMILVCLRDLLANRVQKKKNDIVVIGLTALAVLVAFVFEKIYYLIGAANKNSFLEIKLFEDFANYPNKMNIYLHAVLGLNHADFTQQKLVTPETFFLFVNVIIVVMAYVVIVLNIREFIKGKKIDMVGQVLSIGFVLISLLFIITNISVDINSSRYIGACPVVFGILIVQYMRNHGLYAKRFASEKISCGMIAIVLSIVLLIHNFIPLSNLQVISSEQERVTQFLRTHNLKDGYANFWDSSVVTVLSESEVEIRPITIIGTPSVLGWGSKDSWYDASAEFVLTRSQEWDGSGVTYENVLAQFGEPKSILEFENYKVLIYNYDISEKVQRLNS